MCVCATLCANFAMKMSTAIMAKTSQKANPVKSSTHTHRHTHMRAYVHTTLAPCCTFLDICKHSQTCNTFALIGLQRCRRRCLCLAPGRRATRHMPHEKTCACLKKRIKNLIENSFWLQIAVIFALCGPLQLLFRCCCCCCNSCCCGSCCCGCC